MNLKDRMMKEYQGKDVIKTMAQIEGDIQYQMKNGFRHSYQDKRHLSPEIAKKLEDDGFVVEAHDDKSCPYDMMVIKW